MSSPAADVVTSRPRAARSARVLIVDDEPSLRMLLGHALTRHGLEVDGVATGEEALDIVFHRPPDVMLLDIMLPGIDGLEVLRRLGPAARAMPIVVLTAHGSIDVAVEAMKLGARDFLTKPFDTDRLDAAVRNGLEIARLAREVERLRLSQGRERFASLVGWRRGLHDAVRLADRAADADIGILLLGESGTGKELFAKAVHAAGSRRGGPFVTVDGAALPEALVESELFGHEKGAFTGADRPREGKLRAADGGTLFLDEVGELPLPMQAKLLRALQERRTTPLGASEPVGVDVRVISATNRDLKVLIDEGRFREDLYFRLSAFPIEIPPLRQRREDIPDLVAALLARAGAEGRAVDPRALAALESHDWPGNVRELDNVLRRALLLAGKGPILRDHLPEAVASGGCHDAPREGEAPLRTLDEVERDAILHAMSVLDGNLTRVAKALRIGRTTLYRKLDAYGLRH